MKSIMQLTHEAPRIKAEYPPGTRILLSHMNDRLAPVPDGTRGTVMHVDDIGQIFMHWDNGRSLPINVDEDLFRKLTDRRILKWSKIKIFKRCMWGSDYPIAKQRGKAISLADGFYWIYQKELEQLSNGKQLPNWLIGIENLMAVRQACIMAELSRSEIEDLYYYNAERLFLKK